jgi:hypothetical protein
VPSGMPQATVTVALTSFDHLRSNEQRCECHR